LIEMFDEYLVRWALTPDGEPIVTPFSRLLPVRQRGAPLMLKIALAAEEKRGSRLMVWWDGQGAARVFAHDGDALLLERAVGPNSLSHFARNVRDDEATHILCEAIAKLHAVKKPPPADLIPLDTWFADLWPAAEKHGGILVRCAAVAHELLTAPEDIVVLHGDIHHDNVLDFGQKGWLAIDPKGLIGERGFDYANLFCNPDYATATEPQRLLSRVAIVARDSGLEHKRLLKWLLAWTGLSAAWFIKDNLPADTGTPIKATIDFEVARLVVAELRG
jgi:streptomycin 6-kinase